MRQFIILCCLLLVIGGTQAQQQEEIWVTTQDYLSLRIGPGQHWERVAILSPGVTVQAIGRTFDTDWIQIAYEGVRLPETSNEATIDGITYGWVSSQYLMWSGNVLLLPVDGIQTITTSRQSGPLMWIGPDTLYFATLGDFENPVQGAVQEATRVEITGRIGSAANGYFWLQFELNDRFYWTPTWATGTPGNTNSVLDASYLFPFGRVFNAIGSDLDEARLILQSIRGRWQDLDSGFAATCNDIPERMVLNATLTETSDIGSVPIFQAPFTVLQSAIENINTAIANFEQVCDQPLAGRTASAAIIAESLFVLRQATDELNFLGVMLDPIADRNPIVRS